MLSIIAISVGAMLLVKLTIWLLRSEQKQPQEIKIDPKKVIDELTNENMLLKERLSKELTTLFGLEQEVQDLRDLVVKYRPMNGIGLEKLSVEELKQLKKRNKEISKQINEQILSNTVLEKTKEMQECVICQDAHMSVVLQPCNHFCVCEACSTPLQICPLCRNNITKTIKIYPAK